MTEVVHILDRFVPELQQYLLIEDIGSYLIAEGLLSGDDYLMLTKRTSNKEAVVELLHLVRKKGPDCLESFLNALRRSCTEATTPHQGHLYLWELFQANRSEAQPLKKQKSRSLLSLLSRTKRNKNSKSNKELSSPLWISTPHSATVKLNDISHSSAATMLSPLVSRKSMLSPVMLSSGTTSDEESYRHSIHDSSSSQDSYNPEMPLPPPPVANNTQQCLTEELQKENGELKNNLKEKEKELDKSKAKIKEQSLHIEKLKTKKEKYKSKMHALETQVEHLAFQLEQITEHDTVIDDLEKQVEFLQFKIQKLQQEKESFQKIVQGSLIPTRGPNSKSQRSHSLGHRTSGSLLASCTSLNSINEIEELKCELNKKDAVLHHKLDHITQICQGMQQPSKPLNKKWYSEIKLVQHHHHQEYGSSYLHSQT